VLLVEAGLFLALARVALLLPFSWVARSLGSPEEKPQPRLLPPQLQHARRVGWAVRTMARRLPFEVVCLPQAMAGKGMLSWRGVPSTLSLGLRRKGEEGLMAHAWLRAGPLILTGSGEDEPFVEVARFA